MSKGGDTINYTSVSPTPSNEYNMEPASTTIYRADEDLGPSCNNNICLHKYNTT